MVQEAELQFDRSILGVEVDSGTFTATKDQILTYCAAIGETNPLYTDEVAAAKGPYGGLITPPMFLTVFPARQGLDPKIVFGNTGFHAGQRCEFSEPIRPGDTIAAKTAVTDVYEKTGRSGRMVFATHRVSFTNQRGEQVGVIRNSFVRRNAGV